MTEDLLIEPLNTISNFQVGLAQSDLEVQEAQHLRYEVFITEDGAQLVRNHDRQEQDWFDPYCDHILVRDPDTGEVVGTCRILAPKQAERMGGWYCDTEFDLSGLRTLQPRLIEVGRFCIHSDYRNSSVFSLLWGALANYMRTHEYEYLMGCSSISLTDGGATAAGIYFQLKEINLSSNEWRVFPLYPFPVSSQTPVAKPVLPALMEAYIRLGASICGDPAWDPNFHTANFLMLVPLSQIDPRGLHNIAEKVRMTCQPVG